MAKENVEQRPLDRMQRLINLLARLVVRRLQKMDADDPLRIALKAFGDCVKRLADPALRKHYAAELRYFQVEVQSGTWLFRSVGTPRMDRLLEAILKQVRRIPGD